MKVYFKTSAFVDKYSQGQISITENPSEAELVVMGAGTVEFEKFKKLKAVYRFGVGEENIPFEYLKERSTPVYFPSERAKEILYESTANFTAFLIFHMYYSPFIGQVNSWAKYSRDFLSQKKLLVIGTGNIGKRVIKKMKPIMKVLSYDILTNKPNELKPLLESADIVTIHIPFANENRDFIDEEKLSWMKNDAILVNTSRGAIVNEEPLYNKLVNTKFKAAFDVFWNEPYTGKLRSLGPSKFFMTPHTASQTNDFVAEAFNDILGIIEKSKKE